MVLGRPWLTPRPFGSSIDILPYYSSWTTSWATAVWLCRWLLIPNSWALGNLTLFLLMESNRSLVLEPATIWFHPPEHWGKKIHHNTSLQHFHVLNALNSWWTMVHGLLNLHRWEFVLNANTKFLINSVWDVNINFSKVLCQKYT